MHRRAVRGKLKTDLFGGLHSNFGSKSALPGLVPGIHVLTLPRSLRRRRRWPGQARPRGDSLAPQDSRFATVIDSPDSPAMRRRRFLAMAGLGIASLAASGARPCAAL